MKIAIRLIFDNTLPPFVDILIVDGESWHGLSYARMKANACKILSMDSLKDKVSQKDARDLSRVHDSI